MASCIGLSKGFISLYPLSLVFIQWIALLSHSLAKIMVKDRYMYIQSLESVSVNVNIITVGKTYMLYFAKPRGGWIVP